MMFILVLSKEHDALPMSEVKAILEGEGKNYSIIKKEPVLFIETETVQPLLFRSSMLRFASRVIGEVEKVEDFSLDLSGRRFSLRYYDFSGEGYDRPRMERIAGSRVRGTVDLEHPEITVGLIRIDKIYITEMLERKDPDFKSRINQVRPFKTNLALQPKMARMLVNLARVRNGNTIVDPFCGGGSVLMEALLMGINAVGVDSSEKMVHGCRKNLEYYGLSARVVQGDFSIIKEMGKFDAIVTDPPYGRGSTTNRENVKKMYERMFKVFIESKRSDGFVSLILPSEEYVKLAGQFLNVVEVNSMKVHRSLTRYFTVLS